MLRARLEAQVARPCRVRRRTADHVDVELGTAVLLAVVASRIGERLDERTTEQLLRYAPEVWLVDADRVVCTLRGRDAVIVGPGDRLRCVSLPDVAIALDDVRQDRDVDHRNHG